MSEHAHSGIETEIKLAVEAPGEARRRLRKAGFRVFRRRVFEANQLYDTAEASLRSRGELLRLRRAGPVALVTFKGRAVAGRHKSREELEMPVADPETFDGILARLGFQPTWRYEKYRTEFRRPGESGIATLDETPIGTFFELEGAPDWIDRTAAELGYTPSDYITASYAMLYAQWCESHASDPARMVFSPPQR